MTILIPVLGDQLSCSLASLNDVEKANAVVLLMEVTDETTYVRHHKRKIALILSAMRHFADELRRRRMDAWTMSGLTIPCQQRQLHRRSRACAWTRHRASHDPHRRTRRMAREDDDRRMAEKRFGTSRSKCCPTIASSAAYLSFRPGRRPAMILMMEYLLSRDAP
jgi:deoxyribodipyrimidine photolyase-like uncharacterized protein